MQFGPVPLPLAEGAILAHSIAAGTLRLKKGRRLGPPEIAALAEAGLTSVVVARLDDGDLSEDMAAARIAAALAPDPAACALSASAPFTGRVNFFATEAGLLRVEPAAIDHLNAVDPGITLATLPDWARVAPRQMVATVKIIPYGIPGAALARALASCGPALHVAPFRPGRASLILTRTPGFKPSLLAKGAEAIETRLRSLGVAMTEPVVVPHDTAAVAEAIAAAPPDTLVLILGASATSDAADVCPAGLLAAGGRLIRFGMPVDPGNLLFLGTQAGRFVLGLPGCARSPALNGADWVLERLVAGFDVSSSDIAAMGVGGLLKEIPQRPQPRSTPADPAFQGRPRVGALVLAAGFGRRMRGRDKLLEPVRDGRPILRAVVESALTSQADLVAVVLPPEAPARRAALAGLKTEIVEATDCAEGMAASLRAGLRALDARVDAIVVLLADMPEVTGKDIDRLIAAHDPAERRDLCRAVSADGTPGHPVLFGRRYFEALNALSGDVGARDVLRAAGDDIVDVPTSGQGATTDLDTPEDWAAWRART